MVRADYTFIVDTDHDRFTYGNTSRSAFSTKIPRFLEVSPRLQRESNTDDAWGIIIKRDTWRNPCSNYKGFVELNREIVRKKRVGTYSQRNPFYGNHLLPGSKTGDPYLARFKRSAFLPRRRHFPRKRIPFSSALSARGNFLH